MGLAASNMTVNVIAGVFVLLGIVLLAVTVRYWRGAVEDHESLAPLEIMSDKRFARADESKRLALLNQVRPEGADPVSQLAAPSGLTREPLVEPERSFRDPFSHDDDAVDVVVEEPDLQSSPNAFIDPLLSQHREEQR
jgi:hypothetical protein